MIQHSGIGSYLRGLLGGFNTVLKASGTNIDFTFLFFPPLSENVSLPGNYYLEPFPHRIYSLKEQLYFPVRKLSDCEILHYPHYNAPLRWERKLLVNFHDLNHLLYPQWLSTPLHHWYAKYFFTKSSARADRIIVPTEFIRQQVIKYLKVPEERLTVIPYAPNEYFSVTNEKNNSVDSTVFSKYNLPESYLLTVGIHKPHKNYLFLLKALVRLWQMGKDDVPPLVMVGFSLDKKTRHLQRFIADYKIEKKVKVLGMVPEADLPSIYRGASALIFPSLYEGFGLPVLEAMKSGIPVVASDIPAVREVAQDAVLYFDPKNIDSLVAAVLKITNDSALRHRLIECGLKRQSYFSWRNIAQQTLQIYQQLTEKN